VLAHVPRSRVVADLGRSPKMKLLIAIILCFLGLLGRAAQPDVLRYESMKLDDLVREVLESADVSVAMPERRYQSRYKTNLPQGRRCRPTFQRALALRKRFPYCVSVAMIRRLAGGNARFPFQSERR